MTRSSVMALLIASVVLFVGVAAKRSRSRPKVRCGLPAHDYQVAKYSPKRRAVSAQAIGIPAPVAAPVRTLIDPGARQLITSVAGEAFQTFRPSNSELQRIVSDEISNPQMERLFLDAITRLDPEEVELQQLLSPDADNAEIRRRLVETLQELNPGDAELQAMLTDAGISNQNIRNLLASTLDTTLSAEVLPPPQQPTASSAADIGPAFVGKSFQFVESPILRIDHCSVSKMSVQVYETGRWHVSLQADQNPLDSVADESDRGVWTSQPSQRFTAHLQRNQFFVRVYCYANHGGGSRRGLLGGPVLIPLDIEPFWVQKGVSLPYVVTGNSRQIRENFQQIDRVEIEFYYRAN